MRKRNLLWLTILVAISNIFLGCQEIKNLPLTLAQESTQTCTYEVVKTYPHDADAFTQGLIYDRGKLYESTGLHGKSSIRKVDLETGEVLQIKKLDRRYFGEGLTLWQDKLIQLTWVSKTAFVYDQKTFNQLKTFSYPTQGWGLTHNDRELILSDGSDTLYFLDPDTFKTTRQIQVHDGNKSIDKLNELEYVKGEILANVWLSDRLARISPETGEVLGWIDLTGIINPLPTPTRDAVLNGIAYDAEQDRLLVTGKLWSKLFEIDLVCQ